ncbi:DUF2299 domain-containing protein [Metallosphaera tengchongensis]|uniref:DUF2299 domain-containing protein n=1 Tax=Metallosphaera tengchongensis TaxID=1532350 RepID=A0A6N0NUE8_9CREN|nr:DUF2299 domain-containing protein [Metallosphaera tengchongensis]QKQ99097.1 DUF2299 domain-containing protein [Metallosphaera tengchongensis]
MEIMNIFRSLGLNVKEISQPNEFMHFAISPQQGGPQMELIKPKSDSKIYIMGMAVGVHQYHASRLREMDKPDRADFLNEMKYRLLKMKVDVAFTPPNDEIPQVIFVSRVLYDDNLDPNTVLRVMYKVRNAGTLVIFMFADRFGVPQGSMKFM